MNTLRFAIPKGTVQKPTVEMLNKAGFDLKYESRSYRPYSSDSEIKIKLLRPQEIPKFVEEKYHDIGITGQDWVLENNADIKEICNLEYGKVRLVLAIPKDTNIDKVSQLAKIKPLRVSTEYVNIAKDYFKKKKIEDVRIEFSYGATEAKPPEEADAILDITETGSTLDKNNLKIIDEVLISKAVLIANKDALKDSWKKNKIEDINTLLLGVVRAQNKVLVKMNVPKDNLENIIDTLPALEKPTVSTLYGKNWYAIETVIEENLIPKILPKLKKYGVKDIIEFELKKVIP